MRAGGMQLVRWAIQQDAGTPTNKLILVILAARARLDGRTDQVNQAELAAQVGISLRQMSRCIRRLVALGLIARGPEPTGTHRTFWLMVFTPGNKGD